MQRERQLDSGADQRGWLPILGVVLVSLWWRLPSLFDPPWVNDEGTYFAVAQALTHGYRLYVNVWENKPPALYLVYTAVYHSVGASLIAMRCLGTAACLCLVLCVFAIGNRQLSRGAAMWAAMLCGLLLGVPFLEGTTANAEVFLAPLTAFAVLLALEYDQFFLAGVCIGAAILFKVVGAFDGLSIGLWLVLRVRQGCRAYVAGIGTVLVLAGIWALGAGILPAMVRDAFLYDIGYVGHANGGGISWLLLLKGAGLLALTWWMRARPFLVLWLLYATVGALFSGRLFGHYLVQVIAPLSLTVSMMAGRKELLTRRSIFWLPAGFLLLAAVSAVAGWSMAATKHDSILARRLQYYANAVRRGLRRESVFTYRGQLDDHVNRNLAVVRVLRTLPHGRLLVWGNTPWIYVLSDRLPATPYTSSLRQPEVPGETHTLRSSLVHAAPAVVVVIRPPAPALGSAHAALSRNYRKVTVVNNATIYARTG